MVSDGERWGVVTRRQLLAAGLTERQVDWRVRTGRLIALHPGVYAVGHAALRPEGHWLAAVLSCGEGADLSHRSVAYAYGIGPPVLGRIEVTAPRRRRPRTDLLVFRNALHPQERTTLNGIPVTTRERTVLDLAATRGRPAVDTALEHLARQRRFDGGAFAALLELRRGARGAGILRAALDELHPATEETRSKLEARALALIAAHGLPQPAVNTRLLDLEVDLLWREHGLVVELDSRTHHLTPSAFEDDRRRDAKLLAAGYRVLRLTYRQVTDEPAYAAEALRAALRPAHRRATPPRGPAAAAA
ncbi:MAG TPA: type IV toxin-antitoxin system AbiEi family antitoxin domain-containing protein [Capillimicrobium sp.]